MYKFFFSSSPPPQLLTQFVTTHTHPQTPHLLVDPPDSMMASQTQCATTHSPKSPAIQTPPTLAHHAPPREGRVAITAVTESGAVLRVTPRYTDYKLWRVSRKSTSPQVPHPLPLLPTLSLIRIVVSCLSPSNQQRCTTHSHRVTGTVTVCIAPGARDT